MSRMLSPGKNQPSADLIMTPVPLALELINHFPLFGKVLDPARGEGAFFDNFPDSLNKNWAEIREGKSFFSMTEKVDWVFTNPPWSKAREYLLHGMHLADNIVYLMIINHFTTKRRLQDIRSKGFAIREFYGVEQPKSPWPSSGFQLVAGWLQRGYKGPVKFSGTIEQ